MTSSTDDAIRFGFLVHDVSRLHAIVVDRMLKPLGITRSQWQGLAFLSRRDGMTQTALANDLDLTKVAVGSLLERLENLGLTERRADQRDARIRRVFLTRAGERLLRDIRKHVEDLEAQVMDTSTVDEFQVALGTLARMKHALLHQLAETEDDYTDGGRRRSEEMPAILQN